METILLVVLIVIAIAMIGLVLLQRSEGGALGIGGPGAMFSARGTASVLTRATAGLAAAFMILSLVLAILSGSWTERESVLDAAERRFFRPRRSRCRCRASSISPPISTRWTCPPTTAPPPPAPSRAPP